MTSKLVTLKRLGLFLLIPFGVDWAVFFFCLHRWGFEGWTTGPYGVLVTMGMFAPMLGNILARAATGEDFKDALLEFRPRGNLRWYVAAVLIPMLIGVIISVMVNAFHGDWRFQGLAGTSFIRVLMTFMESFAMPLLYAGLCCFGEEFGWRGYLDRKLEDLTGLTGAVLIGGTIWGLWHAPLVAKGYNFGPGHPVLGVVLMCVSCIFMNAILMWLTESSGSIYPTVIAHGVLDLSIYAFVMDLMISVTCCRTSLTK